jgi:hypothetical protein
MQEAEIALLALDAHRHVAADITQGANAIATRCFANFASAKSLSRSAAFSEVQRLPALLCLRHWFVGNRTSHNQRTATGRQEKAHGASVVRLKMSMCPRVVPVTIV